MAKELKQKGIVRFSGIGSLKVIRTKSRLRFNVATKTMTTSGGGEKVKFTPSKVFKIS